MDSFTRFDSVSHENDVSIKEYEALHRNHSRIFFVRDTSKCFRTEKLENLRYYGKYGFDADGIFSMLFAHKCRSFMSIPIDGYYWTLRSDSVSGRKLSKEVYEDRLDNWMAFYKQILRMNPSDITTHERDYLDYCYEAVWKYASLINASDNKDKRLLAKYTRFIFFVMRRLKVSVGDTLSQRLMNYFYLFFPVYKIKSINRGT